MSSWIAAALWSGVVRVALFLRRRVLRRCGVYILSYHHVIAEERAGPDGPRDATPVSWFNAHLRLLAKHFTVVSLDDALRRLKDGPLTRDYVVITFDDGYKDNYAQAFPLLREYGFPATTFLIAGLVGTSMIPWYDALALKLAARLREGWIPPSQPTAPGLLTAIRRTLSKSGEVDRKVQAAVAILKTAHGRLREDVLRSLQLDGAVGDHGARAPFTLLSWDEARQMACHGMSFGSHTMNHPVLTNIGGKEAMDELETSKAVVARQLGGECRFFAFPNGDFTTVTAKLVKRAGYGCACTQEYGMNRNRCDPFELKRIAIGRTQPSVLALKLTGIVAPLYTARRYWRRTRTRTAADPAYRRLRRARGVTS